jgi:hypothetical protein
MSPLWDLSMMQDVRGSSEKPEKHRPKATFFTMGAGGGMVRSGSRESSEGKENRQKNRVYFH